MLLNQLNTRNFNNMTELTLSIKEWIDFIENAVEKKDFKNILTIKSELGKIDQKKTKLLLIKTLYQQGWQAFKSERFDVAKELFYWLEQLDPTNWQVHLAAAMLRQKLFGRSEATRQFRSFVKANPVSPYQVSTNKNAIKIGVLITIGKEDINFESGGFTITNGLTETQHLTKLSDYSVALLCVEGISAKNIEPFDCIINAVSDSDMYRKQMLQLQVILKYSNKPIINHPQYTLLTTRDYIYNNSKAIDGLIIPKSIRVSLNNYQVDGLLTTIAQYNLCYPVLIRPTGTQNGQGLVVLENDNDVSQYQIENGDYYLSEYYEFKSKDGFYRKYRCWCIGDSIILNHLYISDKWNVHSSARKEVMVQHSWMFEEEKNFLLQGSEGHNECIKRIALNLKRIIGLDYFGMDFNLTENGEMILFEANATMLSSFHSLSNPDMAVAFPYMREVLNKHRYAFHYLITQKIVTK